MDARPQIRWSVFLRDSHRTDTFSAWGRLVDQGPTISAKAPPPPLCTLTAAMWRRMGGA
jgi:hypothetical protein